MEREEQTIVPDQQGGFVHHTGRYDRTIYFNPVNKYCVLSIRTEDTSIPEQCRSQYRCLGNTTDLHMGIEPLTTPLRVWPFGQFLIC